MKLALVIAFGAALLLTGGCTESDDEAPEPHSAPPPAASARAPDGFSATELSIEPATLPVKAEHRRQCPETKAVQGAPTAAEERVGPEVFGVEELWTSIPVGLGVPTQNNSKGNLFIKMPWWRGAEREFTLTARRIGGERSDVVQAQIPKGYGRKGFVSTLLAVPDAGCWLVTGTLGPTRVTLTAWIGAERTS